MNQRHDANRIKKEKMDDGEEGSKEDEEDAKHDRIVNDVRIYCKLGHFYLLLENYAKGESFFPEIKSFKIMCMSHHDVEKSRRKFSRVNKKNVE